MQRLCPPQACPPLAAALHPLPTVPKPIHLLRAERAARRAVRGASGAGGGHQSQVSAGLAGGGAAAAGTPASGGGGIAAFAAVGAVKAGLRGRQGWQGERLGPARRGGLPSALRAAVGYTASAAQHLQHTSTLHRPSAPPWFLRAPQRSRSASATLSLAPHLTPPLGAHPPAGGPHTLDRGPAVPRQRIPGAERGARRAHRDPPRRAARRVGGGGGGSGAGRGSCRRVYS